MGCFKSKTAVTLEEGDDTKAVRQSIHSVLDGSDVSVRQLTAREIGDVRDILNVLRDGGRDLVVAGCAFDRLFLKCPEVKEMFIFSDFLDPDHEEECYRDPWFQGFLKAFVNSLIKFAILLDDEPALRNFLDDLKEMHERIKGIKREHIELITRYLYDEVLLSIHLDNRHRTAWRQFLLYLCVSAIYFLPVQDDKKDIKADV